MEHQAHHSTVLRSGTPIPRCIYGTAEKIDPELIFEALKCGFRGLDTACQPQYYHEEAVGMALARALTPVVEGGLGLDRADLYIQTKFTTPAGQDMKLAPYKQEDSIATKVHKSIQKSLSSLGLPWVDTLLLHGPMPSIEETIEVWKNMECLVPEYVHNIGLSNMTIQQVKAVCDKANVWPVTIQNRFRRHNNYDHDLRNFCSKNCITYQAFSILRSNRRLLSNSLVGWLAEITGVTAEEALLNLVLSTGTGTTDTLCILIGTGNKERMKRDIATFDRLGKVPGFIMEGFNEELHGFSD